MARVYVGTYAKYTGGSIAGAWLDLEDYVDKDGFIEACKALHSNEEDPELMFQDYEGIPESMISESHIDEDVWEWLELSDDDQELLAVYLEHVNQSGDIDKARDAFRGKFDDEEGWAMEHWEDSGMLGEVPEFAQGYIDYASYARDEQLGGGMSFVQHEGYCWAFRN